MRAAITEAELTTEERAAELVVRGFASRPEVQRSNRNGIYVFVNRRLVRDRLILHAIHEAYRNVLPPAVFPAVLLFLDMPAEEVDVNVHPAKIEVRFRHPQFVHDFTRDSIRQALSRARPIPSFAGAASGVAPSARQGRKATPPRVAAAAGASQCELRLAARRHSSDECSPMRRAPAHGLRFRIERRHRCGRRRSDFQRFRMTGVGRCSDESQRFRFDGAFRRRLPSESLSDGVAGVRGRRAAGERREA